MTTPDPNAPVTPDAPPPPPDTPPPDAPTQQDAPPPDAPPPDAPPPDAPQQQDAGDGGDGTDEPTALPSATSNETPVALPIEYTQYPPPPG